jgi:hypothetical protein
MAMDENNALMDEAFECIQQMRFILTANQRMMQLIPKVM